MSHLTTHVDWAALYERVGLVCSGEVDGGYKVHADLVYIRDNIQQMINVVAELPQVKRDQASIAARRFGLELDSELLAAAEALKARTPVDIYQEGMDEDLDTEVSMSVSIRQLRYLWRAIENAGRKSGR